MTSNWTVPGEAVSPVRHPEAPAPGESIPAHWHGCFGCRGTGDGGLGLDVRAGEGAEVTGEIVVDPAFEGGPGVIHGGVLSSVFDEVMGFSAKLLALEVVTAHLEVDFRSPVPVRSALTVRARVDGVLGRKLYASAEVYVNGAAAPAGSARALFITIDQAVHFRDLVGNSTRI